MLSREIELNIERLNARYCVLIADRASQFKSSIYFCAPGKTADAKSLMGLISFAPKKGQPFTIKTDGKDELGAMTAVIELLNSLN